MHTLLLEDLVRSHKSHDMNINEDELEWKPKYIALKLKAKRPSPRVCKSKNL